MSGPYRYWHHLHEFHECGSGTQMLDIVHYELPFRKNSLFSRLAEPLIQRDLRTIFDYRQMEVGELFNIKYPRLGFNFDKATVQLECS